MSGGRVIQFGTSRFLQAHVDLFIHEAREEGQRAGPIAVVKTSHSSDRQDRVAAFNAATGFPVVIRGISSGQVIDSRKVVTSVDRGLSAASDWPELSALFAEEADYVVSNSGDQGFAVPYADRRPGVLEGPNAPASFPAMLASLLWRRWCAGARPLTILPCELTRKNGTTLRRIVTSLAWEAGHSTKFVLWLEHEVLWADTLVDRIVSEPIEPIGAVAEPYALWAIARRPGMSAPCRHPAIVMTDDLEPFERLKLHILNLGHTVLAQMWREAGAHRGTTVRALIDDEAVLLQLAGIYHEEVVPGFARHGLEAEAKAYLATTVERFRNPYLDHRLADIAEHHAEKVAKRVAGFLQWIGAESNDTPYLSRLVATVG